MNARAERLRTALAERAAREAALCKALCANCGGWAHKGEGDRDGEPPFVDVHTHSERTEWLKTLPPDVDGWRRTCARCVRTITAGHIARDTLAALIGVTDLSEQDATRVLDSLVRFDPLSMQFRGGVSARAHEHATGRPWEHVTDDERERLRTALGELLASRMPRASSLGGCGMCGRGTALGEWRQAPSTVRWPEGDTVAFCNGCAVVWMRRGEPSDLADLRRVGVECATGRPVPLGNEAPSSFRLFAESKAADPSGLAEPWSWSPALTGYVESVWEAEPDYAPEDRRDEFQRRHDERDRERVAQYRQERERKEATTW